MASSEYAQLIEFLGRQFTAIDGSFGAMERQIAGLRQEVLGHFDEVYRRLERLEQEQVAALQSRIQEIEQRFTS